MGAGASSKKARSRASQQELIVRLDEEQAMSDAARESMSGVTEGDNGSGGGGGGEGKSPSPPRQKSKRRPMPIPMHVFESDDSHRLDSSNPSIPKTPRSPRSPHAEAGFVQWQQDDC